MFLIRSSPKPLLSLTLKEILYKMHYGDKHHRQVTGKMKWERDRKLTLKGQ